MVTCEICIPLLGVTRFAPTLTHDDLQSREVDDQKPDDSHRDPYDCGVELRIVAVDVDGHVHLACDIEKIMAMPAPITSPPTSSPMKA